MLATKNTRTSENRTSGGRSAELARIVDTVSDEERRLAAELEAVMTRRPGTERVEAAPTAPAQLGGADGPRDFSWRPVSGKGAASERDEAEEADLAAGIVPPSTLSWLTKARRLRRRERLRSAAGWLVSLGAGLAIVLFSSWMLLGKIPGMAAILGLAARAQ